jgi:hypothetical protein
MKKIPEGMVRQRGMWNTIEYSYRGIRISKNSGRYQSGWVCYVGEMKLSNRIIASTLNEMAKDIDQAIEKVVA